MHLKVPKGKKTQITSEPLQRCDRLQHLGNVRFSSSLLAHESCFLSAISKVSVPAPALLLADRAAPAALLPILASSGAREMAKTPPKWE